jgi:transketolase
MSKVGLIPFTSTFAAFFSRAYDQIRMGQYSEGNLKLVGSHAGVSIGSDGSSQMALEDLAMMRAVLTSVVLYPSDAISTISIVKELTGHHGLSYLRLTREKTISLYKEEDMFPIGGSKVLKSSEKDTAVIVSAGITVHEAIKAYDALKKKGTNISIIDAYSIKPLDENTILEHAKRTGHVIVVEDHYPAGGLGEAIATLLTQNELKVRFTHLCVRQIPRSGTPEELLSYEGIDAASIINVV